jgi:ectoine hydroxylase-related dioxygenase (phytanoyl-CoA dioxygenase family)
MLSHRDVELYREHGYIALHDFLDAKTLERMRHACDMLVEKARGMTKSDDYYDFEPSHTPESPRVRRLKKPIYMDPAFHDVSRDPRLLDAVAALIGPSIRLSHPWGKLNVKAAQYGAAVEWHQDWAAYPHTNDDLLAVGIPLDDCLEENGPLLMIPGSHKGPAYDHNSDGVYTGGMDPTQCGIDFSKAVPLTGRAGMVTLHHVRMVHGSALNRSSVPRRLLLIQYAAVDAWPILGIKDWNEFNAAIVRGKPTLQPRMEAIPIRVPYPKSQYAGSVYEEQRAMASTYFERFDTTDKAVA